MGGAPLVDLDWIAVPNVLSWSGAGGRGVRVHRVVGGGEDGHQHGWRTHGLGLQAEREEKSG